MVPLFSRELKTFVTVAAQGSFLKASGVLYTTPSAVMKQVNHLEERLGFSLFDRTNQGLRLTPAGRAFHEDAKILLEEGERAVERARQIARGDPWTIRIGTSILRPCGPLVDLWSRIGREAAPFAIRIVPFDDSPAGMESLVNSLGREIDCFVGPCDSLTWQERCTILPLEPLKCRIGVPRGHRLAGRERLDWADLEGESLLLVRRGESPVLNRLRDEVEREHPGITVLDTPHFYDTAVFNECVRRNCLMETLDIWKEVHPALVTLPMAWDWRIPCGVLFARNLSPEVQAFLDVLRQSRERGPAAG